LTRRPTPPTPAGDIKAGPNYPPALPRALLAGTVAVALADGLRLTHEPFAGKHRTRVNTDYVLDSLWHPLWLLLLLTVLALPVLVACWQIAAPRARAGQFRAWHVVSGAAATATTLSTVIASGAAHPITVAPGDYTQALTYLHQGQPIGSP